MNDPLPLLAGTVSHYRIIEKIGAGGMGVVYRAHDDQLDRDVALKVLPSGTVSNEECRKQFRKEALALAKLNHPNIETVFEFSTHDGMDFLAMELITGQTLSQKLKDGPLPQEDIVRLALQISDGLSAAHEKGIIHRDIKPGNMIITPDGRLKILDFGLAMLIQPERSVDLTQSVTLDDGRASGTLPYMSPEQLRGLNLDSRSDIFAAGVVLYEMATGRRPFLHAHTVELMAAILHNTPDAPSLLNAAVSPGLERVICTALEKEPANRYHTAREMRVALDAISSRSGHTIARHTETHPDVTPDRAFPRSYLVIGGIAVLLIVLTTLWYVRLDRGREHANNGGDRSEVVPTGLTPVRSRRSVAVLGFKNLSQRPDKAWYSTAIPGMLTTELAAGEQLRRSGSDDDQPAFARSRRLWQRNASENP
jgi:serine/threonine protein kinase